MRHMRAAIALTMILAGGAGCGGSSPTQTAPSPAPPVTGAALPPAIRLEVKADEAGSRDAVAMLSEVIADASASGPGLTFAIDFGDGTVANTAVARHVYGTAGTFTISCTATSADGHKASASAQVTVRAISGGWFQAQYVPRSKRVEVRKLTVEQEGLTVRGIYKVTGDADRAFTGTLTRPRNVRITVVSGATLEGALPGSLGDDSAIWTLTAQGDSVDGERLSFRPIPAGPLPPAPDAVMRVRFNDLGTDEPAAAVSAIDVDGTSSRGSDLSYFIEFGDGFVASSSHSAHPVDAPHSAVLTAQLTVVDGFGRSDAESAVYRTFELGNFRDDIWSGNDGASSFLSFHFTSRAGASYDGVAGYVSESQRFVRTTARATLSGDHDVRIVLPDLGIEFRGSVELSSHRGSRMTLIEVGGPHDGRRWTLGYNDGE